MKQMTARDQEVVTTKEKQGTRQVQGWERIEVGFRLLTEDLFYIVWDKLMLIEGKCWLGLERRSWHGLRAVSA